MGTDELSRWRDALIIDRDDALIDAAKRWLGPVKTPFNKHELIAKVEAFLRRTETVDAIVGLLDRMDRRILALALFSGGSPQGGSPQGGSPQGGSPQGGSPQGLAAPGKAQAEGLPLAELVKLAADDSSGEATAQRHARSLKERLVLYSYPGPGGMELFAVAPPLAHRLAFDLSPADALSIARKTEEPDAPDPFATFCAIVSGATHAKPAFKGKLEPSKRAAQILDATTPGLSIDKSRLEALLGALEALGIAGSGEDGRPAVYPRRFVELCDEAGDAAPFALAAGCAARTPGCVRIDPALVRVAILTMPRCLAMMVHDVHRVVAMAIRRFIDLAPSQAGLPAETLTQTVSGIVEALLALGIVSQGEDGLFRTTKAIETLVAEPRNADTSKHPIVVEESHEIRILPEAGLAARAFVSAVARLESAGLVWTATLDKSAAKAAYAYGFRSADIADRLEKLSGVPLPQSVRFSLDAWESEARSARVRVGVVVALDGHLSGVLEHSPKASGLVVERLADGVYLLAAHDAADAERLLKSVGIDVDIRTPPPDDIEAVRSSWREAIVSLGKKIPERLLEFSPSKDNSVAGEPPLMGRLLAALDSMAPSADERSDLEDRIRARLILDESQLHIAPVADDGSFVGAMDYPGKVRLIERALKDGCAIEVAYADESGNQAKATGIPREIRRTPSGTVVALSTAGNGQSIVAISAIGKVRRLRNMMFGV